MASSAAASRSSSSLRISELGERLVGDVGERSAAEQRERLARRARRPSGRGRARRLGDEPLEPADVHLLAVDPQLIRAPAGDDLRSAVDGQRAAQPPDVVLHHLGGARRRLVSPQALDQPVGRHRAVGLEPEHREHGALLRPADRDGLVVDAGLERAEDADLHEGARVLVLARDQPNHLRRVGINGHRHTVTARRSTPGLCARSTSRRDWTQNARRPGGLTIGSPMFRKRHIHRPAEGGPHIQGHRDDVDPAPPARTPGHP